MSDQPVEVPYHRLPEELLRRVIEEFVTREGTDYGHSDYALEDKVAQVRKQLERGTAKIVFDPLTETATIVAK